MTSEALSNEITAAPVEAAERLPARDRLVINILLVSTFIMFLNETVMNVAIPQLMKSLDVPASAAQWLTTAFLITTAVVIPVTGFLLQRLSTRPIFFAAMTLFSLGTLMAALAPNLPLLVAARVVQASGTAIMMPLLMTTVMTLVPPAVRGKTMGNISIVMSMAPAIGPVVSGFVLHYLPWRFLFILVLPIALGALALGGRRMLNIGQPGKAPLDVLSVVLSALAFGGIVYGLSELGGGNPALPAPVALGVGLVTMALFVWRQLRLKRRNAPLLDLDTFRHRNFSVSVGMMAIAMMAMFGSIVLLPIYLQDVVGLDTLGTGLLLLPGGLLMGSLGPLVGRLYDRVGPAFLIVPGVAVISLMLWALTLVATDTWPGFILIGYMVMSVGFALLFTPLFTVSLSSVPPGLYSHASAVLGSIQQVAGAAGVALFVAVMTERSGALAGAGQPALEALAGGIRTAFMVGAVISLFAIIAALFIRRPPEQAGGMPTGH
jgi:DHA2 family lincomycin resistance protein-like MFS transporter